MGEREGDGEEYLSHTVAILRYVIFSLFKSVLVDADHVAECSESFHRRE